MKEIFTRHPQSTSSKFFGNKLQLALIIRLCRILSTKFKKKKNQLYKKYTVHCRPKIIFLLRLQLSRIRNKFFSRQKWTENCLDNISSSKK